MSTRGAGSRRSRRRSRSIGRTLFGRPPPARGAGSPDLPGTGLPALATFHRLPRAATGSRGRPPTSGAGQDPSVRHVALSAPTRRTRAATGRTASGAGHVSSATASRHPARNAGHRLRRRRPRTATASRHRLAQPATESGAGRDPSVIRRAADPTRPADHARQRIAPSQSGREAAAANETAGRVRALPAETDNRTGTEGAPGSKPDAPSPGKSLSRSASSTGAAGSPGTARRAWSSGRTPRTRPTSTACRRGSSGRPCRSPAGS
jgi:hypothetical protein